MDFNSAMQPCISSAEASLPGYTGKLNFTPNLRGKIEAHEKIYKRIVTADFWRLRTLCLDDCTDMLTQQIVEEYYFVPLKFALRDNMIPKTGTCCYLMHLTKTPVLSSCAPELIVSSSKHFQKVLSIQRLITFWRYFFFPMEDSRLRLRAQRQED